MIDVHEPCSHLGVIRYRVLGICPQMETKIVFRALCALLVIIGISTAVLEGLGVVNLTCPEPYFRFLDLLFFASVAVACTHVELVAREIASEPNARIQVSPFHYVSGDGCWWFGLRESAFHLLVLPLYFALIGGILSTVVAAIWTAGSWVSGIASPQVGVSLRNCVLIVLVLYFLVYDLYLICYGIVVSLRTGPWPDSSRVFPLLYAASILSGVLAPILTLHFDNADAWTWHCWSYLF